MLTKDSKVGIENPKTKQNKTKTPPKTTKKQQQKQQQKHRKATRVN